MLTHIHYVRICANEVTKHRQQGQLDRAVQF